jgi:hypothetical protein
LYRALVILTKNKQSSVDTVKWSPRTNALAYFTTVMKTKFFNLETVTVLADMIVFFPFLVVKAMSNLRWTNGLAYFTLVTKNKVF